MIDNNNKTAELLSQETEFEMPFQTMCRVGRELGLSRGVDLVAMSNKLTKEQFREYINVWRARRLLMATEVNN